MATRRKKSCKSFWKTPFDKPLTLTTKYADLITYGYIIVLFALAVLPINGKDSSAINQTYVLSEIRLDYFLHSFLLAPWMPLRMFYGRTPPRKALFWLISGLSLACLTEVIQYFLSYRTYNVIDLLANLLGVWIGLAVWPVLRAMTRN